jgi:hypothetical protein
VGCRVAIAVFVVWVTVRIHRPPRRGVVVAHRPDAHNPNPTAAPNPELVELGRLLVGTWRVQGPAIEGRAEYQLRNDGRVLVAYVDFVVGGSRMRVLQHIAYDEDRDALLARYMDTMGDQAVYVWELDGRTLLVTREEQDSGTYFRATLNDDHSQYVGRWHYREDEAPETAETITYTRVAETD